MHDIFINYKIPTRSLSLVRIEFNETEPPAISFQSTKHYQKIRQTLYIVKLSEVECVWQQKIIFKNQKIQLSSLGGGGGLRESRNSRL